MTAVDHLHPEQLRMFMPAEELHRMPSAHAGAWSSPEEMWRSKRADNARTGLDVHIAAHGVHNPVQLAHYLEKHPVIWEGHHRTDAAYRAHPRTEVPVEHVDMRYASSRAVDPAPVPGWEEVNYFPSVP